MFRYGSGVTAILSCPKIWPNVLSFLARHLATEALDLCHISISTPGRCSGQPPLVILHGMVATKETWEEKAKAIHQETGRTVIVPDARNHGRSPYSPQHTCRDMVNDTAKLIKKLGLSKVSILGHSMGGRVAMALALIHPHLVSTMIVIDVSPDSNPNEEIRNKIWNLFNIMSKIYIRPGITMAEGRNDALEYLKTTVPLKTAILTAIVNQTLERTNDGVFRWLFNVRVLMENLSIIQTFSTDLVGLQYCGPSLFIAGSQSDYIRQDGLPGIQRYFPSAELVFLEAGHNLPFQKEDEFLRISCEFLAKK